jgi:hypothetical protein
MDRTLALFIITWGVMVLLYLGLARVLFEINGLRRRVDRLTAQSSSTASYPIVLSDDVFTGVDVLLVAESSCARCWAVLEYLVEHGSAHQLALLTYEEPTVWSPCSSRIQIIRSTTDWASMAHLSPPILLRLDRGGAVADIALPVGESDLKKTLDLWRDSSREAID